MTKYFFIGSVNENNSPRGGAEAKNLFLLRKLKSKYNQKLDYVDMTSTSINLISLYIKLIKGLVNHQHIILSVASTALGKLAYLNFYLKRKNVTIFIIGGVVDEKLIKPRMRILFENTKLVFAETRGLAQSIRHKSIHINVKHLPNFKLLIEFTPSYKSNQDNIIRCVFLSRVHRDKGVFRAIDMVLHLNETISEKQFILDIYGPIELSTADKMLFDRQIANQNINYKGYIDLSKPEAYTKLSSYHLFMFLTNHPGEGFPGVLIDALHSGTIIIASDWRYNKEIVPQSNLLVNLESNYQEVIKDFIIEILSLNNEYFQNLIVQQQKQAQVYNIDNIDFELG